MAADARSDLFVKRRKLMKQRETWCVCCTELCLEGIGEPNPGEAGFPEQSRYWCVPAKQLKEMFAGKKDGSNKSSAYSAALNGLKDRNLLQMNSGLVWMPTEEGTCQRAERSL